MGYLCTHPRCTQGVPGSWELDIACEDEPDAARLLAKGLRAQSFAVDLAGQGEEAVYLASLNSYDLIILDVMLPRKDGFEVCRELRTAGLSAPVLMLTARDEVHDRITGLDSGADDYLVKPFDFNELLARARALLRRGPSLQPELIEAGDLRINTRSHSVERAGEVIQLTTKEYALLEYLMRRANQVVSRAEIAEHVWDESFDPFSNLIEVYIQRLRRKIDEGRNPKLIRTLRGEGYLLAAGNDQVAG
jgi:two-component system copper resistance phosphate regulon response regulator CusR